MDVTALLREYCMAKPGAVEERPWGGDELAWKVRKKIFAMSNEGDTAVVVKSTLEKQAALIQDPNITVAPYVGRFGWVRVEISDEEMLRLAQDLVDESYEAVAGRRKPPS